MTNGTTNLNQFLYSKNSLAVKAGSFTSGFDFDTNTERSAVTGVKLRNFSFNAGTGGTIVLGGINNGNGVLRVQDASGGTVVTLNNTGLTVTNGSISILNASGSSVLDSSGLVSTTTFRTSSLFNGSVSGSTTGTTYTDISGATLSPLIVTRTTRVLVYLTTYGRNNNAIASDGDSYFDVSLNDSVSGGIMNVFGRGVCTTNTPDGINFFLTVTNELISRTSVVDVLAGTHNYKLQYKAVDGGTAFVGAYDFGYVVLGA